MAVATPLHLVQWAVAVVQDQLQREPRRCLRERMRLSSEQAVRQPAEQTAVTAPTQRLSVPQVMVAVAVAGEAPSEAPSQRAVRVVVLAPCRAVVLAVWHQV